MKICESWLQEWVSYPQTVQALGIQLTMAGLEIDSLDPVAQAFDLVIVAKVLQTKHHPEADKLTICEVEIGKDSTVTIVCGAPNVRSGLKVALALPGAHLPNGIHIKESKIRGVLSQGMLCSVSELGIEDKSEGILELPDDAPIGVDLREYMQLNDYVLEINLTPNRADCFSVLGVAREIAALNHISLKSKPIEEFTPSHKEILEVEIIDSNACPRYCGRIIRGININAITPLWIKERLRRSGLRSINPVVDVTNYVMLELGQPMHAFDLLYIDKGIKVRFATENETLTLLDGQNVTLNERVLVIADKNRPLALAGVMGGEESAVTLNTQDIFLESAFFDPIVVAGVARSYGLSSDSSQRYERGVDFSLQRRALERASVLLHSIVGGEVGPVVDILEEQKLPVRNTIIFNPMLVKRLSGLDITYSDMERMLVGLGLIVELGQIEWRVTVPSYRFDLALDVDLVEEIIRLYGYGNINAMPLISSVQAGEINLHEQLTMRAGSFLSSRGYHETISYSFVDPVFQEMLYGDLASIELINPISSELSQMRLGLWPGLLASMIHNLHRQQSAFKLFETGVTFNVNNGKLIEESCLSGLIMGKYGELNWSDRKGVYDFYDMKGDLEALFKTLGHHQIYFEKREHTALHPGKSARIMHGQTQIGWIGALHPRFTDEFDLNHEVLLFEIYLETLTESKAIHYRPISKYPQTRRDLSILIDESVSGLQVEQAVRASIDESYLKSFDIFDVYTGDSIPSGKKSLAISLTLQNDKCTLNDADILAMMSKVVKKLEYEFSAILRIEMRDES